MVSSRLLEKVLFYGSRYEVKNAIQALAITLCFSALGIFGLLGLGKEFNPAEFVRTVKIDPLWGIVFVASLFAWWLVAGWRIQLLSNHKEVTLSRATRAFLLYLFGGAATPSASGANVAMAWYLSRYTDSRRATAVAVFSLALDLVFYAYALPFAFIYLQVSKINLNIPIIGSFLGVVVAVGMLVAIGMAYGLAFQSHQLEKLAGFVCQLPFLKRFRDPIVGFIRETAEAMTLMRGFSVATQFQLHLSTFFNFFFHFIAANLVLLTLGFPVDHLGLIAAQILLVYFSFFIPLPGGAGYFEIVLGTSSASLGIPKEAVVPFVLIWRILSYYLYFLIGPFIGGAAVLSQAQAAPKLEEKA
jgi:glycosyltransferase 2 family protein